MKLRQFCAVIFLLAWCLVPGGACAKDKIPPQTGWGHVLKGPVEVRRNPSTSKPGLTRLQSGALVAVFETKQSKGTDWAKVRVVEPATLEVVTGWVESSRIETLPVKEFPSDSELLKALGGVYLQDFHANYTQFARYLVRRGTEATALVCYVGSPFLPHTRLQVFEPSRGKFVPGPYLEFPFSQMKTGVTQIEVRDLVGDGDECLIAHEPLSSSLGSGGANLVIRRIEAKGFKVLWQAPLELRNLSSYPPHPSALEPPEKNIGAPGTVTTATVDFRSSGRVSEPVWKGKIEFRVPGREEPVDTLTVEKVCNWNGREFTPLY